MQNQISDAAVADPFVDLSPSAAALQEGPEEDASLSADSNAEAAFETRPAPLPHRTTQDLSAAVQRVLAWHHARSLHH